MKDVLERIFEEFFRRPFPEVVPRDVRYPMLKDTATVITGMRRTGKTSLCICKMHELFDQGIDRSRMLYLNFEDDRLAGFSLDDCQTILDVYFKRYPDNRKKRCFFFFDEIQNLPEWERFIRRLLDTANAQVTLTGSSSKLLTSEIATAMRGRSVSTEVLPFSFKEYLRYFKIFDSIPGTLCDDDIAKLRNGMERYFQIGAFPGIYKNDDSDRDVILQEYVDLVVLRDVIERHSVGNMVALRHLVAALFNAPSQKFSVNKFANLLGKTIGVKCSRNDIYHFLDYLVDAYIVFRMSIHSESEKVKQVNPDKIYLIDIGLIRAMARNPDKNRGHLLENLIYLHLRRQGWHLEYYHNRKGQEVDFLAYHRARNEEMLVQVCYDLSDAETMKREIPAITLAGEELKLDRRYIITWDEERALEDGTKVIPAWKFMIDRV